MQHKRIFKAGVCFFCLASVLSAVYLHWSVDFEGIGLLPADTGQKVLKEESFLPEVQFIKELIRSIFNIVKTAL
jgi:hypothetical protein